MDNKVILEAVADYATLKALNEPYLEGQLICVTGIPGTDQPRQKLADGETPFNDLPWLDGWGEDYGDFIDPEAGDIVYLDTEDRHDSNGIYPKSDKALFVPSIIEGDTENYPNPSVPFPGRKPAVLCAEESENIAKADFSDFTDGADCDSELLSDGFLRVKASATVSSTYSSAITKNHAAFSNGCYGVIARRGTEDQCEMASNLFSCIIDFDSKTVTASGVTVALEYFFSSNSQEYCYVIIIVPSAGSTDLYLFPRRYSSVDSGGYTDYKKMLLVDVDYPLPYFEGVKEASELVVAHERKSKGTYGFWAYVGFDYDVASSKYIFDGRNVGSDDNRFIMFYRSSTDRLVVIQRNNTGTDFTFETDTFTSGTWLSKGLHFFELQYDWTDANNWSLKVDNSTDIFTTKPALSGTFESTGVLRIGQDVASSGWWDGIFSAITYKEGLISLADHYTSELPYIDPNTRYTFDGMGAESVLHGARKSPKSKVGTYELVWGGASTAPSYVVGNGIYMFKVTLNNTSPTYATFVMHVRVGTGGTILSSAFTAGVASNFVYVAVSTAGVISLGVGGTYLTAEVIEIYKLVE